MLQKCVNEIGQVAQHLPFREYFQLYFALYSNLPPYPLLTPKAYKSSFTVRTNYGTYTPSVISEYYDWDILVFVANHAHDTQFLKMFSSFEKEDLLMINGAVMYGRMSADTKWIFSEYLNVEYGIVLESASATDLYLQAVQEMNTKLILTIFQSKLIPDITTHNQVFLKCCSFIDSDLLELFLNDNRIDINYRMGSNSTVTFAVENPKRDIIARILKEENLVIRSGELSLILARTSSKHLIFLLNDQRMEPFYNENDDMPIILASRTGKVQVVKFLLAQESVNPAAQSNSAVIGSALTGNSDLVQLLVNDDRVNPYDQASLIFTNCGSSLRIFRYLRNDYRANVSLRKDEILTNAILHSNTELIDFIIDEKIVPLPEFKASHLLALAIQNYAELLQTAIKATTESVSFNRFNTNYLESMYRNGNLSLFVLFIPLLDQTFEGTGWLETQSIHALTDEHFEMFELLLSNKYYNIHSFTNPILKLLITQNKPDIVVKVLQHKSFKPTKYVDIFKHLMQTDNIEIAKILLKDKRIDPSQKGNTILKRACIKRKSVFVKLLLNHKKVDPTANDYEALKIAAESGHAEIIELFRNCKKVDQRVFAKITNYL
ncbi:hypothetical protein HDV01_004413 [Terramyces sp. JEL0728]|nr:hypothetical protein HDV01_004413 [Terramyces sp. JEL0728]